MVAGWPAGDECVADFTGGGAVDRFEQAPGGEPGCRPCSRRRARLRPDPLQAAALRRRSHRVYVARWVHELELAESSLSRRDARETVEDTRMFEELVRPGQPLRTLGVRDLRPTLDARGH